jgi:hypothetical protein
MILSASAVQTKRQRIFVVLVNILVNRSLEFCNRGEAPTADAFARQIAEESLDDV